MAKPSNDLEKRLNGIMQKHKGAQAQLVYPAIVTQREYVSEIDKIYDALDPNKQLLLSKILQLPLNGDLKEDIKKAKDKAKKEMRKNNNSEFDLENGPVLAKLYEVIPFNLNPDHIAATHLVAKDQEGGSIILDRKNYHRLGVEVVSNRLGLIEGALALFHSANDPTLKAGLGEAVAKDIQNYAGLFPHFDLYTRLLRSTGLGRIIQEPITWQRKLEEMRKFGTIEDLTPPEVRLGVYDPKFQYLNEMSVMEAAETPGEFPYIDKEGRGFIITYGKPGKKITVQLVSEEVNNDTDITQGVRQNSKIYIPIIQDSTGRQHSAQYSYGSAQAEYLTHMLAAASGILDANGKFEEGKFVTGQRVIIPEAPTTILGFLRDYTEDTI